MRLLLKTMTPSVRDEQFAVRNRPANLDYCSTYHGTVKLVQMAILVGGIALSVPYGLVLVESALYFESVRNWAIAFNCYVFIGNLLIMAAHIFYTFNAEVFFVGEIANLVMMSLLSTLMMISMEKEPLVDPELSVKLGEIFLIILSPVIILILQLAGIVKLGVLFHISRRPSSSTVVPRPQSSYSRKLCGNYASTSNYAEIDEEEIPPYRIASNSEDETLQDDDVRTQSIGNLSTTETIADVHQTETSNDVYSGASSIEKNGLEAEVRNRGNENTLNIKNGASSSI